MKNYKVRVERHLIWNLVIAAENEESARDEADKLACECHPNDDQLYSTDVL
jgi:hypothetical protein